MYNFTEIQYNSVDDKHMLGKFDKHNPHIVNFKTLQEIYDDKQSNTRVPTGVQTELQQFLLENQHLNQDDDDDEAIVQLLDQDVIEDEDGVIDEDNDDENNGVLNLQNNEYRVVCLKCRGLGKKSCFRSK